ncbi:uncharacterized protein LOC129844874 isoform X2 [Salvelinus fontinalis]|uniref:uncharacterized protein LOC129844874 isoform X2 n=1 Tax=Salvelinus fontinalis TaxID=8038 RepID=UPI002486AED6|nr:uncharacterized protein LOC129844874 isoform X2 [Salvelinus fontinalis]
MRSLSYSLVNEEEDCWTEKGALVKEEEEEEDVTVKQELEGEAVTVKQELEGEAVTVKQEEKDVSVKEEEDAFKEEEDFTVKEEEEAAFGVKEEEGEEEPGYLGPVSQTHLKASNGSKDELSHNMVLRDRSLINTKLPI